MQHTEIELNRDQETYLDLYLNNTDSQLPLIFIVPGGGYKQFQAKDSARVALSFMTQGFQTAVIRYPVGDHKSYAGGKETVAAAVEYVVEHSAELNVDSTKLGMIGFSAGGQLVAEYSTHLDNALKYVLLGYPVIEPTLDQGMGVQSEDINQLVTDKTLPTFIFGSINDTVTPYVQHIGPYSETLAANHVPFELHEFGSGKHGISLANEYVADQNDGQVYPEFAGWFEMALKWLQNYIK